MGKSNRNNRNNCCNIDFNSCNIFSLSPSTRRIIPKKIKLKSPAQGFSKQDIVSKVLNPAGVNMTSRSNTTGAAGNTTAHSSSIPTTHLAGALAR